MTTNNISNLLPVQQARRQILREPSSISLIEQQESPDSILKKTANYQQRCSLYISSADLRTQQMFAKVHMPNHVSTNLLKLHEDREKLQKLNEVLTTSDTETVRKRFNDLPAEYQNFLRWGVWFKDWLNPNNNNFHNNPQYGTKTIDENLFVLRESADKVIYLRGKSLVEQLMFYIEDELSIGRQKENEQNIQDIAHLMGSGNWDKSAVLKKIEELPLELQWKIHDEIQKASSATDLGFEWGKRKLYEDPAVLIQLKHPQSNGESILQFHLRTQKELLECCVLAKDVAEFEKMAILFPLAQDVKQKEELKKWLAPKVRSWICSLESTSSQNIPVAPSDLRRGDHSKLYESRGAQFHHGKTTFQVYAPHAKKVSVILTAYGKEEQRLDMQKSSNGIWEITTPHAQPAKTYLYLVEDCQGKKMLRTDPFSFSTTYIPEVDQVQSVVVDPSKYQWKDQNWISQRGKMNPLQSPLSIYELQVKSWKSGYGRPLNFREMAPDLIAYCKKMGFTHVECYGLLEHFSKDARGYQVSNFFAPYRDCGSCDDFKYLVDQLHQNGIGIIIDWIPTHFQHYHKSESYSVSMHEFDGTNLFAAEKSPWGTLYLDYGKEETRRLMFASALYFLDQLHVDGIRFDAISQMVHRNGKDVPSGISFLKELNDTVHSGYPGVMMIAEETEGFPNVTKPTKNGGLGFDMKWNIGWSIDSRNFLRTPYNERPQHWHPKIVNSLHSVWNGENTILTHSHDDTDDGERSNNKVLLNCVSHIQHEGEKFSNLRNFFSWQAFAPSCGHLLHMGDEIVQNESWYRRFRKNTPSVDWSLGEKNPLHHGVQDCVMDLNALYLSRPQFWEKGAQDYKLISEHGSNGVIAYHRGTKDNKRLAVVHNFSNKGYSSYDLLLPTSGDEAIKRIQQVSEIFNSDHAKYKGSGHFLNRNIEVIRNPVSKQPTHLRLSLPPLSTVVLEEQLY